MPPAEGLSLAMVNVGWAIANLVVAYLLLVRAGKFDLRDWGQVGVLLAGFTAMAMNLAHYLARFHGGS